VIGANNNNNQKLHSWLIKNLTKKWKVCQSNTLVDLSDSSNSLVEINNNDLEALNNENNNNNNNNDENIFKNDIIRSDNFILVVNQTRENDENNNEMTESNLNVKTRKKRTIDGRLTIFQYLDYYSFKSFHALSLNHSSQFYILTFAYVFFHSLISLLLLFIKDALLYFVSSLDFLLYYHYNLVNS
jgi:hypothetical protein